MKMHSTYSPPLALTILSAIFLLLGAICFVVVTTDIIIRRGWRSMMRVMVVVYPINALYMLPVTLYSYFKYGRPSRPGEATGPSCHQKPKQNHCHTAAPAPSTSHCHSAKPVDEKQCCTSKPAANGDDCHTDRGKAQEKKCCSSGSATSEDNCHSSRPAVEQEKKSCHSSAPAPNTSHNHAVPSTAEHNQRHGSDPSSEGQSQADTFHTSTEKGQSSMPHCHSSSGRPFWATLVAGVSHCGAGCVLGDIVGEFVVYGSGAKINGADVWPCLLVDYAFALVFGIAFQYWSIAPMSGDYSLKTVWRAAKADVLSLTSFEVGAFAWMVIFQVGIFDYKLSMVSWTYWWMMQIGMVMGFGTALPMNWFLITKKIKEPCC